MGKIAKNLTVVSTLLLLVALLLIWGCSQTNPLDIEKGRIADKTGPGGNGGDDINLGRDDDGGTGWPDVESGKYSDSLIAKHLFLDPSKPFEVQAASGLIGAEGGNLRPIFKQDPKGKHYDLYIKPYSLISAKKLSMEIKSGKNKFDEELITCNFMPQGQPLKYYPIFQFKGAPNVGASHGVSYTLYFNSGGTWKDYGTKYTNNEGEVYFVLPQLGTFAILLKGGPTYRPPNGLD